MKKFQRKHVSVLHAAIVLDRNVKGYPLHLGRDAYLFRDHDSVGDLYGVVDGVLRAERITAPGLRQILGYFEQGNIIGFALQSVQQYSVVAITPARFFPPWQSS